MNPQYFFTSVSGVLPDPSAPYAPSTAYSLLNKRTYIARGCRPHMTWVSNTVPADEAGKVARDALGSYTRLKGDGTSSREEREGSGLDSGQRLLTRLVTVDGATGQRLVSITAAATASRGGREPQGRRVSGTRPIPSGARVAAVAPCDAGGEAMIVSDVRGNIYRLDWRAGQEADADSERNSTGPEHAATRKRARSAEAAAADSPEARAFPFCPSATWQLLVEAQSVIPSTVCGGQGGQEDAPAAFRVSRGSSTGFVGLGFLGVGAAQTQHQAPLVCVREGYNDVRVVDLNAASGGAAASVVRTYSTTHRPTGLYVPSAWPFEGATAQATTRVGPLAQTVLVCEGALATLFDIRCPSAVMTVSQLFQAAPDPNAAAEALQQPHGREEAVPPLVPGRLTSVLGTVSDVCPTANPFEVALAVDRALCVYDFRKFTRLFSSSNVVKYAVATVAATAGGHAVVCAGVDSEVRIIPLHPQPHGTELGGAASPSLARVHHTTASAAGAGATAPEKAPQRLPTEDGEGGDAVEAFSTFRTRLNTSVSCQTAWQGGWITSCNGGGAAAVGISLDHEVFMAQ